ncbi:MAG: crossover junction endodeoxyribonuclease RuvC [Armatimonadetes bacterium]|nr:crossover junction endodeoxyribonuclease RuvC [Armatimonadota bacterium]
MTVLGVDPGYGRLGYGVVRKEGSRLVCLACGVVETQPGDVGVRLAQIYDRIDEVMAKHLPDALATERLFFTKNQTTGMDVAKAAGCVLLAAARRGLASHEYAPTEVKLSVVGNGAAEKKQVQFMVAKLLGLASAPKPDDAADALAVALTHALRAGAATAPRR